MEKLQKRIERLVKRWRRVLQIDPRWQIDVAVLPAEKCVGWSAQTTLDAERWEALLEFSAEATEGDVVHELLELASWEEDAVFWAVLGQFDRQRVLYDALGSLYKAARNRRIEKLLPLILESQGVAP